MPAGFWLRTDCDNIVARRFYEKSGLSLRGEAPRPISGEWMATYEWP